MKLIAEHANKPMCTLGHLQPHVKSDLHVDVFKPREAIGHYR